MAIPQQEVPEGLYSLSSDECGSCHVEHYNEWKMSTHAHAWTDLQFQAELKKESSPFLCINCHIPLQNQQKYIIKGLIDGDIYNPLKEVNLHFDERLQQEGINCAACHVRNNVVIGTSGTTQAPHKTVKDPDFLSEQLCITCHNASAVVTPSLVCSFETGDEWQSGPFFGKKNCISCHMETVKREIVAGYGEKMSYQHYFAGSGIAKFDSVDVKGLNGLGIYPGLLKRMYAVEDTIFFTLRVKNEFAGHKVPTGDPERFFNIVFELKNEKGKTISIKEERIGEHWEWDPVAKKISENNIAPTEERVFSFSHPIEHKEQLTLMLEVTKHRLDQESADFNGLGDNYPLFISIFYETYEINVR